MDPLLTPHQVAEILGISPRTVNALCNRKNLRFIQVDSKHRRFTPEMIQEFLDSQTAVIQGQQPNQGPKRQSKTTHQPMDKSNFVTMDIIRKEMETWE